MLFKDALLRQNKGRPPVWFMRQAGRYHSHYQALRSKYSFMELCKKPEVACEVTMGPIRDFDFDAAILFSDLLFPLEVMGMGLKYEPAPELGWHLESLADVKRLKGGGSLAKELQYQADAMKLIRKALPASKGLIGFVGGPLTLFGYAVEGSHSGGLKSANAGLRDGRFAGFMEKLEDLLAENMALQARGGADAMAMFDTAAGDFDPVSYREIAVPAMRAVLKKFKAHCPDTPIIYYSRGTGPDHWSALQGLPITCLGVDWRHDLADVLTSWGKDYSIQGNIDPEWLLLEPRKLEAALREAFGKVKALPVPARQGWICGLGHGVLQKTPETNVRLFIKLQREFFGEAQ